MLGKENWVEIPEILSSKSNNNTNIIVLNIKAIKEKMSVLII